MLHFLHGTDLAYSLIEIERQGQVSMMYWGKGVHLLGVGSGDIALWEELKASEIRPSLAHILRDIFIFSESKL